MRQQPHAENHPRPAAGGRQWTFVAGAAAASGWVGVLMPDSSDPGAALECGAAAHRTQTLRLLTILGYPAETRQLVARDRRAPPGGDLVVIAEGDADALRPACRAGQLVCPIDDCVTPAISARGGQRRDHFFHLRAGGQEHGPERLAHQHAKAVLSAWAGARHPHLDVRVEARVETGQRADVLLRSPTSGARLAIEMQCGALTAAEWCRRTRGYTDAGIAVQWLWWNHPPHLRRAVGAQRGDEGVARRPALLDVVLEHGREWLWFDPGRGVLGAAVDDVRFAGPLGTAAMRWYGRHVAVVPLLLSDCSLTAAGLAHPTLRELARLRASFTAHDRAVADSWTRDAHERFAADLARLQTPLHSSVIALLSDIPDGGDVVAGDVCDGTMRLAAIGCAGRIGSAAHPAALRLHLELVAETLTTTAIPAGALDRVAGALRRSAFIAGDIVIGSIDVPPGSDGAAPPVFDDGAWAGCRTGRVSGEQSHRFADPTEPVRVSGGGRPRRTRFRARD